MSTAKSIITRKENASSTPAYSDNPDWYYEEDGGYQSCLGPSRKESSPPWQSLHMTTYKGWPLLSEWHHKIGLKKLFDGFFFFSVRILHCENWGGCWRPSLPPSNDREASEA